MPDDGVAPRHRARRPADQRRRRRRAAHVDPVVQRRDAVGPHVAARDDEAERRRTHRPKCEISAGHAPSVDDRVREYMQTADPLTQFAMPHYGFFDAVIVPICAMSGGVRPGIIAAGPLRRGRAFPRGGANPKVQSSAEIGRRLHEDKPGQLPDQLRERFSNTEFEFAKPGQPGQDARVVGGTHPSEYPESSWPKGVDFGDFKPDTPSGLQTFESDQRKKWNEPTFLLRR